MNFEIFIQSEAIGDIQDAVNYYNSEQSGLGNKFVTELEYHFSLLIKNPFYQVRYGNVRWLPLKKFPFMIHFTIDNEKPKVIVRAVFNTYKNPEKWISRTSE